MQHDTHSVVELPVTLLIVINENGVCDGASKSLSKTLCKLSCMSAILHVPCRFFVFEPLQSFQSLLW